MSETDPFDHIGWKDVADTMHDWHPDLQSRAKENLAKSGLSHLITERGESRVSETSKDLEDFEAYMQSAGNAANQAKSRRQRIWDVYMNYYQSSGDRVSPSRHDMEAYSRDTIDAALSLSTRAVSSEHTDIAPDKRLPIEEMVSISWLGYAVNGGIESVGDARRPVGKIYINTKPNRTPHDFVELTETLGTSGIRADIKMPLLKSDGEVSDIITMHYNKPLRYLDGESSSFTDTVNKFRDYYADAHPLDESDANEIFNRADQIVMYFHPEDAQSVVTTVREFTANHTQDMRGYKPRFASPVLDDNERVIHGVGFVEDYFYSDDGPDEEKVLSFIRRTSFGNGMSTLLYDRYLQGPDEGLSLKESIAGDLLSIGRHPDDPGRLINTRFHFS